jgi:DNA-binding transcriptional LysR family regulator
LARAAFEAASLGVVDSAVGQLAVSQRRYSTSQTSSLFDEPNVIVAGSDSHWAKGRSLKLADLIKERWVSAQPGSLARSSHDDTFRRNGFEPPSATVLTVWLHLYMRMVETGHWLGPVPASVMRFGGKDMRLKILPSKSCRPGPGRFRHREGSHADAVGRTLH